MYECNVVHNQKLSFLLQVFFIFVRVMPCTCINSRCYYGRALRDDYNIDVFVVCAVNCHKVSNGNKMTSFVMLYIQKIEPKSFLCSHFTPMSIISLVHKTKDFLSLSREWKIICITSILREFSIKINVAVLHNRSSCHAILWEEWIIR